MPQASASDGTAVTTMTLRAKVQIATPRKPVKTDRIGERAGEQREDCHGGRPDPPDECGRLIAEAEVPVYSHSTIVLFVTEYAV